MVRTAPAPAPAPAHIASPALAPRVCVTCQNPPAAGAKLRFCSKCTAVGYCSADCQRADWGSHKVMCAVLGLMHTSSRSPDESLQVVNDEHVVRPARYGSRRVFRCAKDLLGWYTSFPSLPMEVMCMAWRHRGERGIILVQTSASGVDSRAPTVTAVPWRTWVSAEMDGFDSDAVRNLVHTVGTPGENYVACIAAKHPGTEEWPSSHFIGAPFTSSLIPNGRDAPTAHMNALVALQALRMEPGAGQSPAPGVGPGASSSQPLVGPRR